VKQSMARIKFVLHERSRIYDEMLSQMQEQYLQTGVIDFDGNVVAERKEDPAVVNEVVSDEDKSAKQSS
jgi:hypothetical protein